MQYDGKWRQRIIDCRRLSCNHCDQRTSLSASSNNPRLDTSFGADNCVVRLLAIGTGWNQSFKTAKIPNWNFCNSFMGLALNNYWRSMVRLRLWMVLFASSDTHCSSHISDRNCFETQVAPTFFLNIFYFSTA